MKSISQIKTSRGDDINQINIADLSLGPFSFNYIQRKLIKMTASINTRESTLIQEKL